MAYSIPNRFLVLCSIAEELLDIVLAVGVLPCESQHIPNKPLASPSNDGKRKRFFWHQIRISKKQLGQDDRPYAEIEREGSLTYSF